MTPQQMVIQCQKATFHLLSTGCITSHDTPDATVPLLEERLAHITAVFIDASENPEPLFTDISIDLQSDALVHALPIPELYARRLPVDLNGYHHAPNKITRNLIPLDASHYHRHILYINAHDLPAAPKSSELSRARLYYVLMALRGARLNYHAHEARFDSTTSPLNVYIMAGRADVDYHQQKVTPHRYIPMLLQMCEDIKRFADATTVVYMGTGSYNPADVTRHSDITHLQYVEHAGFLLPDFLHSFDADLHLTAANYTSAHHWTDATAQRRLPSLIHYMAQNQPLRPVDLQPIPT
jgi:hypothetical protein